MKQPHIQSNNRTNWSSEKKTVSQPKGIDYNKLMDKISKHDKRISKQSSITIVRKDLRKKSAMGDKYTNDINEDDDINKLDKNSIIPIPGMIFDHLENNDGYSGKSGYWNDVTNNQLTNGPQWNPMTL